MGNYESTVVVFFLIAAGNLLLALFNLFPGYPLDGGRVLRALLWRRSGDIKDATRKAGICGILIGGMLSSFRCLHSDLPKLASGPTLLHGVSGRFWSGSSCLIPR